jgi:hypothetical protein
MKKMLYTIGFLMLLSALAQPLMALGQDQFSGKEEDLPYSSARIFSKLVESTGLNPNANWAESFGTKDEKDVGKNLYLMIYDKTQNQPVKQANRNIAGKYGIPETDLVRFLHGDYSRLIASRPGITQEEAQRKIAEIQQVYMEETELQSLEAEIKAATEPSEIFANGDVSDSGFDLINDLQIIEYLLFLKSNPTSIGASYSPGSSGAATVPGNNGAGANAAAGTSSATAPAGQTNAGGQQTVQTSGVTGANGQQTATGTNAGTGTNASQPARTAAEATAAAEQAAAEEKFNPNACFTDNKYLSALGNFLTKAQTDGNYKDNGGTNATGGAAAGAGGSALTGAGGAGGNSGAAVTGTSPAGGSGASGAGNGAGAGAAAVTPSGTVTPPFEYAPDTAAPVQAAPAGQWLKDKVCLKTFCLTINMVKKTATSAFQDSDNCIACHAEKINVALKNLITHSLVPSKAPGNLGEPGVCKKALATSFGSVSMNIYTIAMPVLTPMNDDLVYGKTIEEDWYNYCNAVAFPFSCSKKDLPKDVSSAGYEIPKSILDMTSKRELAMAADGASQSSVAQNIDTDVTGYELERNQGLQSYDMTKGADNGIQVYQPLKVEMDRMNYFFGNIRDLLHSLHEKVDGISGDPACTGLKSKKECQ